jgi:uncharacterized integral membrane protein
MRKQSFSLWGFIFAALILVLFSVQNAGEVSFKFFIWEPYLPLSVLLIVAFLLGLIVGAIFSFRSSSAQKKEKHKEPTIEKQIKEPDTNETSKISEKEY